MQYNNITVAYALYKYPFSIFDSAVSIKLYIFKQQEIWNDSVLAIIHYSVKHSPQYYHDVESTDRIFCSITANTAFPAVTLSSSQTSAQTRQSLCSAPRPTRLSRTTLGAPHVAAVYNHACRSSADGNVSSLMTLLLIRIV